jgi:hypothetical protein
LKCPEGESCRGRPIGRSVSLIGSFLYVDLGVHLDLRRRRLQLPHPGKLSDGRKVASSCALEDHRLLHKEAGFHAAFRTVWLSISSVGSAWRTSARLRITVAGCRGLCRSGGPERPRSPCGGGQGVWFRCSHLERLADHLFAGCVCLALGILATRLQEQPGENLTRLDITDGRLADWETSVFAVSRRLWRTIRGPGFVRDQGTPGP